MSAHIVVVDDDPNARDILATKLDHSGYRVATHPDAEAALNALSREQPEVLVSDVRLPGMSGLELLVKVREEWPDVDVIIVTGHEDMNTAMEAMKSGAFEYVVKPIQLDRLDALVRRCLEEQELRREAREQAEAEGGSPEGVALDLDPTVVGRDPRMIEIFKLMGVLSQNRTTVFIRGETGTGKELIARAIHVRSPFASEPFLAVNCTALSDSLLESELFGHVRGAFTGAVASRKGFFELAGSGTIFLDEIGDTSPEFQAKLLRVLEERQVYPVGGETPRRTNARVMTASNRPVEKLVEEGRFREDLYFRLRVVEITVPPLRERLSDIPMLARHLLTRIGNQLNRKVSHISDDAMNLLMRHDWPGNVRELENALTRAVTMARGPAITSEHLTLGKAGEAIMAGSTGMPTDESLDAAIAHHVQRCLYGTGGNKSQSARILKISRSRLDRLIDKYDLVVPG